MNEWMNEWLNEWWNECMGLNEKESSNLLILSILSDVAIDQWNFPTFTHKDENHVSLDNVKKSRTDFDIFSNFDTMLNCILFKFISMTWLCRCVIRKSGCSTLSLHILDIIPSPPPHGSTSPRLAQGMRITKSSIHHWNDGLRTGLTATTKSSLSRMQVSGFDFNALIDFHGTKPPQRSSWFREEKIKQWGKNDYETRPSRPTIRPLWINVFQEWISL